MQMPGQYDLYRGGAMFFGHFCQYWVVNHVRSAAKRRPRLGLNTMFFMEGTQFALPKIRVHLYLVDRRHFTGFLSQTLEVLWQEVGNTDSSDQSRIAHFNECAPGVYVLMYAWQRPVNQRCINIGQLQIDE